MPSARLPLVLAALLALVAALTQARAAPLDAETCARLQAEQGQLEDAGVEKDMAKGPEWAKANLGLEKLQRVQRFIEIEEQLLFRCRSKAIVSLTPEKESGAADQDDDKDDNDDNDKDGKDAAKAANPKQQQPPEAGRKAASPPAAKPKKEPARSPKPSAKAAARESSEPGVTSIEKRPPKAKVDDAYKAPPPDPSVNPFATQLSPAPGK
jgi:hypothetical protein